MKKKSGGATPPLGEQVLSALSLVKRPMHPRELAGRILEDEDETDEFLALIEEMIGQGHLEQLPGGRVKLGRRQEVEPSRKGGPKGQASTDVYEGVFSQNPRGFGFVAASGRDDLFIPPDAVFEAYHGDTVSVRITGRSDKGAEGRIERIVKRRNPKIVGVLRVRRKALWLEPDDTRIRGPINISGENLEAADGDACVAEITRFPVYDGEVAEGKIVMVLGPAGDPRTEVLKILANHEVVEEHTQATLDNAAEMVKLLGKPSLEGRRDLRQVPLPTIDPEDARDHDDAIWVERNGSGYRVYVAIADVSEFVRPGSALDDEARARGCTIYLPDRAIPMLPSALAADLCSLLPDVDRYCVAVIAELDKSGQTTNFELVEGVMRSHAKLTYGGVARALGLDPESPQSAAAEAMKGGLEVLAELAAKLRSRRFERGSLDLDLPEARILLDEDSGMPTGVIKRATRPGLRRAYSLVEEMMLLANELVAEWLTKRKAPAIYRVHSPPDPAKLERLGKIGETLGLKIELHTLEDPKELSALLTRLGDHPRKEVLSMLLLRSLKQAQYDIENIGHYGLASPCYLHFTSPIRRYPDLTVHRQVKHILRGEAIDRSTGAVDALRDSATQASVRERASLDVEREAVDLYRAVYMQRHIGDTFDARVTGVTGSGIYVQVDDPFCDVLVKFESMGPDRYEVSEDELSLVGARSGDTVTLGDRIRVTIEDAALVRRTVYGRRELSEQELTELRTRAEGQKGRVPRRGSPASSPGGVSTGVSTGMMRGLRPRGAPAALGRPSPRRTESGGDSGDGPGERRSFKGISDRSQVKTPGAKRTSEKLLARGRTSPRSASEKATSRRVTRKTTKKR